MAVVAGVGPFSPLAGPLGLAGSPPLPPLRPRGVAWAGGSPPLSFSPPWGWGLGVGLVCVGRVCVCVCFASCGSSFGLMWETMLAQVSICV